MGRKKLTPPPGEPRRYWERTALGDAERATRAGQPPDLTGFEDFVARVDPLGSPWAVPVALVLLAVVCGGTSFLAGGVAEPALLLAACGCAVAVPLVYAWNVRQRDAWLERCHRVFLAHGLVVESRLLCLHAPPGDARDRAWVLIDVRTPPEQAARLHAAFGAWLCAARADPPLWARVNRWLRQGTPLVPSERIFGPDAAGGYLAGGWPGGSRWMVVMPSDHRAPDPVRSGCLLPVRDCDGSLEPVPVLGPPE
jgi:hypothetical protein